MDRQPQQPTCRPLSGFFLYGALLASCLIAIPAQADAAREAATSFLYEQADPSWVDVHIQLHPSSAALPPCKNPEPFFMRGKTLKPGNVTVGVRCGKHVRYLRATVDAWGEYLSIEDDIPAGSAIEADHLSIQTGNLSELPRGTMTQLHDALGQRSKRYLRAGGPLQARDIDAWPLVERGDPVTVQVEREHFTIERSGTALHNATLGETLRIQVKPRLILTGIVIGPGSVKIQE